MKVALLERTQKGGVCPRSRGLDLNESCGCNGPVWALHCGANGATSAIKEKYDEGPQGPVGDKEAPHPHHLIYMEIRRG